MEKIKMLTPIVELDGDEMTRVLWKSIKEKLILPFVELNTVYYDLSLRNREATADNVTVEAAAAIKKYRIGVKCATITPNADRVKEYGLTKMWKSPNATIRAALDGTVFRAPIMVDGSKKFVPGWTKPITVARHAYGDVYSAVESRVKEGRVYLDVPGSEPMPVFDFKDAGVVRAIHNTDKSITSFAKSCFNYAISTKQDLWFATKDTISKTYDHRFKDIFNDLYESEYKEKFQEIGIEYFYTLIDDAVARIMRSSGGMIWALKNYDGDVMSDMVAAAFGSLAMMTSVLVSPDGCYEYEAAHGTVTRHYYRYLKGEETSTNPMATIFAWAGALKKNGEINENQQLIAFADELQKQSIAVITEDHIMTKDLVANYEKEGVVPQGVSSEAFLDAIKSRLDAKY